MSEILCGSCKSPITCKTEVEYSEEYNEFYCNFDCALEELFNKARCAPFDFKSKQQLRDKDVELRRNKFYWKT